MIQTLMAMSPVILLILSILVIFSILSWTIIIYKSLLISGVRKSTAAFLDYFHETGDPELVSKNLSLFRSCPLAVLFGECYRETHSFFEKGGISAGTERSSDAAAIESISRSLRKASARQIEKLEKDVNFLATTASATPFIGLFGTVWGIMNAFRNIGQAGSTSLAIVAPGISEALTTTAIGLAVAIPAVIGYNYLQGKIRRIISEIDNFSLDYLNLAQHLLNTRNEA